MPNTPLCANLRARAKLHIYKAGVLPVFRKREPAEQEKENGGKALEHAATNTHKENQRSIALPLHFNCFLKYSLRFSHSTHCF